MKNPTLGYEDETLISKVEIAHVQLVEAIKAFTEKKFICAITLAGAAEDIFAGVLSNLGKSSCIEDATETIDVVRTNTKFNPMNGLPKNKIYKKWNDARNNLKHHSIGESSMLTINLVDEAYWMIGRALVNAAKAGVEIENENEFKNWVVLNVNL